jgi:hypothetical protein
LAKIRIFRIFGPPQLFFPIGKNGLGGCAGRVSGSCITWYMSKSARSSGLGVGGEKPPKTAILGLWEVTPPPLLDANRRNPRRFHVGTVPRVRAKFGEDPSVNKGTSLSRNRVVGPGNETYRMRVFIFIPGFARATGLPARRPGTATASRSWQKGGQTP